MTVVVKKQTCLLGNESSRELSFPGAKVPENFRSPERKFPRTYAPGSESSRELSLPGAKVLSGNFRSEERKYRGAKSPDTHVPVTLYASFTSVASRLWFTHSWNFLSGNNMTWTPTYNRRLADGNVHSAGSTTYQICFRLSIPNLNPEP